MDRCFPARLQHAGVPAAVRAFRPNGEIALAELDRVRAAGVQCGTVLADAGYGGSAAFRQALSERLLRWAVGINGSQKVFPAHVRLQTPRPQATGDRPRRHPIPSHVSRSGEAVLATARWHTVT